MLSPEERTDIPNTLLLLVGRIEGKLDMLLTRDKEQDRKLKDLEERISTIENDRAKVLGIWAAVSLGIGGVGWIGETLFNHFWTK
ncbi:hypothetical protein [Asaia prunellae]|uniref:hypothetical protein n=1 Tax=Asaia prunellae TaxID=610245 RepID=UPI00046F2FE9|nr:hypothetical protein [Asaia prunellae]